MTNDELAQKLSRLEGLFEGVAASMKRIEETLSQVLSLDRTVAELAVRQGGFVDKIKEIEHDIKTCSQTARTSHDILATQHTQLAKEYAEFRNTTRGVILGFKVFSGLCATILLVCGSWVYERAVSNREMNLQQEYALGQIKRDLDNLHRTKP